jgi:hypothetical protein
MTHTMTHLALSAMVIVGLTGCATDTSPSSRHRVSRRGRNGKGRAAPNNVCDGPERYYSRRG